MMGGLVMFSLPVLDTALAFARRFVNKRPFFSADRHHFHHQLVSRALTVRRAVVLSYSPDDLLRRQRLPDDLSCARGTSSPSTSWLFGCIIVTAYKMGMVHERPLAAAARRNRRKGESAGPNERPVERTGQTPP